MHHNIYNFSRSPGKLSFTTKKPQHDEVWLCGFQAIACTCIVVNCYIWTSTKSKATIVKFEVITTTLGFEATIVEVTPIEPCICTL